MLLASALRAAVVASAATGFAHRAHARCEAQSFAQVSALTFSGAEIAMAAARAEAARNGWAVTIVVADASGVPLLVQRDGAAPMTVEIAMGKARTAAISGKETGIFESIVNGREASPRLALLSSPLTLMEGAVPIIVEGAVAGAVGVSGVRSDQDAQVARGKLGATPWTTHIS